MGPPPTFMRARRWLAAVAAVLVAATVVAVPAFGQSPDDTAATETPWRDLAEAERQLGQGLRDIVNARADLETAEQALVDLLGQVDSTDQAAVDVASSLQAARERARLLAVEAYINGGPPADSLFVLDASTANDFAYRATLVSQSATSVASAQDNYQELQAVASDEAIALAGQIDAARREILAAERAIVVAEARIPQLEWVVEIATIHDAADDLMERYGRVDPTADQWDELRFCESTRDYQISTGNGYYGAYQFDLVTWVDMGGNGVPSEAAPEEQDARARYLYALRGSGYNRGGAWPVCGRFLPGS